ncbi:hypothetical protein LTR10_016687 [Elasticomyces elasticus]|nr:hypothetical protein LTR10_016687 [Elasticomyces elasticus]
MTTAMTTSTTTITTTTVSPGTVPPPNFTSLANNVTVSSIAAAASAGTLCSGANVANTQSHVPIVTGAYNYQKVALADYPTQVYEISCWMTDTAGSYASIVNVNSLEYCIDQCNLATPAGKCQEVVWSQNTCYLITNPSTCATTYGAGNCYPNGLRPSTAAARLLTQNAPKVIDYTSLLLPSEAYNLGLCSGSGPYLYDNTFVGVYSQSSVIRNTATDLWLITCGGNYYSPPTGTAVIPTQAGAQSVNYIVPQTADDCARLCAYLYQANSAGTVCLTWTFSTGTPGTCTLYAGGDNTAYGTTSQSSTIMAAGVSRSIAVNYAIPQSAGYKRSLPDSLEPARSYPRDTLADWQKADVILPWTRRGAAAHKPGAVYKPW